MDLGLLEDLLSYSDEKKFSKDEASATEQAYT